MAIEWNRVTWYSQVVAIIVALVVFGLGYWVGEQKGENMAMDAMPMQTAATPTQDGTPTIADVTYGCDAGKTIRAIYKQDSVNVLLSDGRNLTVPHAISADGGRYANDDESFVFWNKGTGAFIMEGVGDAATTTFANCEQMPQPE